MYRLRNTFTAFCYFLIVPIVHLLLKDSAEYPGRCVLACFVINLLQRVDEVHLITFDIKSKDLLRVVPPELQARLKVYCGHEDVLGWKESGTLNVHSDLIKAIEDKSPGKPDRKSAVVIDSISPLLLHRPVPYTCQTLHRLENTDSLGSEVKQVVCLVHQDLHDNASLALVEHSASSIIKVLRSTSKEHKFCCNTLHKKISGKICRNTENFNITDMFNVSDVTEMRTSVPALPQDSSPQTDPAANLTFNLSLTDKEKEARSQVKLPYTYNQQRQDATLTKSVGEGKIFYQPDEADDFDEEDPDDDLDI